MRLRRPLIVTAAATTVLGGLALVVMARPRDASTVVVTQQDVVETAVTSGRVIAPAQIHVGVLTGGVVAEVAVAEGQDLKAGALLLRLDDRVEVAAVAQAKAAVAQARARLAETHDLAAARSRATFSAAEVELATHERRLDRVRRLAATGAAAGVDLEDAEAAVALARSKRDVALAEVNATKAGGSQILVAEAQLEAARAQLQSAEARLAQTRITAPTGGTVLRRDVEPGDAVQPGRTLLVLAGTRNSERELEIVVEPDEKQLAVLAKGQKASCAADAFPDAPFEATVRDIAPLVDAGRGTVEVRLTVAQPPPFLRADMTVSVEVVTGTKEKALVVPRAAVRDLASAEPWVLTLAGDRAEKRPVKLGSRGADVVEVLDGVSGGTTIITDARLKPGARVKPL